MMSHLKRVAPVAMIAAAMIQLSACTSQPKPDPARPVGVDAYIEGVRAYQEGNRDAAIASLEQAVADNPQLTMAREMLGDLQRGQDNYEAAAEHYAVLTQLDPYDYEGHYKLGLSYQFLNRLQESAASYLKSLELNPQDLKSNMNLGLVYLGLGQTEEAAKYLRRATEIDPDSAAAFANLGVVLDAKGDLAAAESAYRKALELDSSQTTTLLNLGTLLIAQNRGTEAVDVLKEALARGASPLAHRRLGEAYASARQYDDAAEQFSRALAMNPTYYPALNSMADMHIARYREGMELDDNLRGQALDAWEKSLQINPSQPRVVSSFNQWSQQTLFRR